MNKNDNIKFYKKILLKFLKENNIYYSYIKNFSKNYKNNNKEINELINDIDFLKKSPIGGAFIWDNTNEGHKFWQNMSSKYSNFLLINKNKI